MCHYVCTHKIILLDILEEGYLSVLEENSEKGLLPMIRIASNKNRSFFLDYNHIPLSRSRLTQLIQLEKQLFLINLYDKWKNPKGKGRRGN